jgi:predicted ATPase/class 3 adenylate cyclase
VTFAFTDIEGSTLRWERNSAAMQDAVRRHDAIFRTAIAEHDGSVFKTIGDAFCAAFARPEKAVAAMLEVQRALAVADFSDVDGLLVRAAIHTGTADEREGDYFGSAVNRVARLLAIGHGGQILVSGVASDIVQGSLPPQASLRSLGEHRLRDLARPEQVYQLLAPGITADFPPLRSLNELPNNLPQQLKSFIGREQQIAEITSLIQEHRLVTLVGSAGVGKTRTSLQVAANLLDCSPDGVWFIELAPLSTGEFIPGALSRVLGIRLPLDGDPFANIARALKSKELTLVLDNCEHLIEPAAHLVSMILRDCPRVRVLATSRQGLGIEGEQMYRTQSLEIAREDATVQITAQLALRCEAIALFVDRALAADKRFALTDQNARAVADICVRLDGIPLAIELAASRVNILSPHQLRERLDERFKVLTGGSRDVLPRQQTLRALINWSHDLLNERERLLFRRLGVFGGGFTLEAAMAIASDAELDDSDVFDVLASLVDKSLVLSEPDGDSLRYRLLESTRIYASEKLSASGERPMISERHLRHFRDRFVEMRARSERTARRTQLNQVFASNVGDVRAALEFALAGGDVIAGAELLTALARAWESIGLLAEGIASNEAFLETLPSDKSLLLAMMATTLADLLSHAGLNERACEFATKAIPHARASGNGSALADALNIYARCARGSRNTSETEALLLEAEAIPNTPPLLRMALLFTRAFLSEEKGDFDSTERIWGQLRTEHRKLGNAREEAVAMLNHAWVLHRRGKTDQAIELSRQLVAKFRDLADRALVAHAHYNLADYLVLNGGAEEASHSACEAIGILVGQSPDDPIVSLSIENLALVAASRNHLVRAAILKGYADATLRRVGYEREAPEKQASDRLTLALIGTLRPDDLARLDAEGAALGAEAAIALALENEALDPRDSRL